VSVASDTPLLEVDGIVTRFGAQTVHRGVSFSGGRGELIALIGGSGTGKSVLLREIVGLHRPSAAACACSAPTCGPRRRPRSTRPGAASA
jgi:phospholipid/cholesterol/gamma-HCH transport system ATP-binding protein